MYEMQEFFFQVQVTQALVRDDCYDVREKLANPSNRIRLMQAAVVVDSLSPLLGESQSISISCTGATLHPIQQHHNTTVQ